jgi:predicted TIM-barrel fold metal-dependent hydrolase
MDGSTGGRLIDVNTRYGYDPRTGAKAGPEEVKEACARWGVERAYTCSLEAVLYDCDEGNRATLELCAREGFFRPTAVISAAELGAAKRVEGAWEQGFRLARLFPDLHGYAVDGEACRAVLEACAEVGLPVMVPTEGTGAASLARALEGIEGKVILTENSYGTLGEVVALASRLPRVMVETSRLVTPDGIAVAAEAFGAERLVWGSNYPLLVVGCAALVLRGSGLCEEEMELIGRGNARRALEGA